MTNNGYDSSSGWGVRVGYQGEFDGFRLGAVYSSKMQMSSFDKYKGLFAEQGAFDIPASYGLGAAFTGLKDWTFAFDWMYIDYGDVPSIANQGMTGAPLGANNGPGFGGSPSTSTRSASSTNSTRPGRCAAATTSRRTRSTRPT